MPRGPVKRYVPAPPDPAGLDELREAIALQSFVAVQLHNAYVQDAQYDAAVNAMQLRKNPDILRATPACVRR